MPLLGGIAGLAADGVALGTKGRLRNGKLLGWPNRETWNVMLWLNNDEPAYREYRAAVQSHRGRLTGKAAKTIARRALGPSTPDGVSLSSPKIRWGAIASAMRENPPKLLNPRNEWRNRTRRNAPRRRNAGGNSNKTASRTATRTATEATTTGNKTSTSTGGASTSGGNVSISVKHNPARVARGKAVTLRNMASVTIRRLPGGAVAVTGRKLP